jgi:hypothetical protein
MSSAAMNNDAFERWHSARHIRRLAVVLNGDLGQLAGHLYHTNR